MLLNKLSSYKKNLQHRYLKIKKIKIFLQPMFILKSFIRCLAWFPENNSFVIESTFVGILVETLTLAEVNNVIWIV